MTVEDVHLISHPSGIGSRIGMFSTSHSTAGAAFFPSPQKRDVRFLNSCATAAVCLLGVDENALPLAAMHTKSPVITDERNLMVQRSFGEERGKQCEIEWRM
jgi:hypothetical protein